MSTKAHPSDVNTLPQYASMKNLAFLLFDVHQTEKLSQYSYFQDYDRETMDMTLQSAKQIADTYLFPYLEEMDREGCRYEDGQIYVPEQIKVIMQQMAEGGWIGATAPHTVGGMQMPSTLYGAGEFLFSAANNAVVGYPGLTAGAARLIYSFGSPELIETYVPHMLAGQWQGTMALTEPQAGSSLSDLSTKATPAAEGHYLIEGQKIFISSGDHDAVDNVVHLMLARLEGAPAGTKGISLFVVPKKRLDSKGNLIDNDLQTAGLFHKMGQKAYATAHLMMGEKGHCHGYLVGEPHQGLRYMFQMMNTARISVGIGGASVASAAYYAALRYALERPQGRPIDDRDLSKPQTLIVNHADVRRMLFLQKAIVEGSISLILQCSLYNDMLQVTEGEEKMRYHLLMELLTPIVKTYPCEAGIQAVSNGLQVLGGYGFLTDYTLEQFYRDIRIMPIYEGTTGIQSQDLLGRKVMMNQGATIQLLLEEITKEVQTAQQWDELKEHAASLQKETARVGQVIQHLGKVAQAGEKARFLSDANLFMEMFSLVVIAWQWLKQGNVARQKLETVSGGSTKTFLESKLHTMAFFFAYELVKTKSLAARLMDERVYTLPEEERELLM
jgi:alkylation response protein AidB-like acyl-CoA dehydrogenase